MDDTWLPIEELGPLPDGGFRARITFGIDSPWFDGHFPGAPLLPGIALVALVVESIRAMLERHGRPVKVIRLSRVRFKQLVQPGTPLEATLTPGIDEQSFRFKITSATGTVSIGTAFTAPGAATPTADAND